MSDRPLRTAVSPEGIHTIPAATSAVERLLMRAEDAPADIVPALPSRPTAAPHPTPVHPRSPRPRPSFAAALVLAILVFVVPATGDRRGTLAPAGVLGASIGEATPGSSGPGSHTVVVEFGDTLWSIAATQLGDPLAWRAIWRANRGLVTAPGSRFDEPGLLQPGWRLSIPGLPGAGSS